MRMSWAWLVLWVSGCATTSVTSGATLRREFLKFGADEVGTNRWHTIEADTFVFTTDLPADQAKEGAQLIAQSLAAVGAMFANATVRQDTRVRIIALASDMEFERVFGTRVVGLASTTSEGTTVFVYGPPAKWFERVRTDVQGTNSNLQHELAHAVLHRYFPVQPRWFAEGMAQFLETAEWLDDQTVRIGEFNILAYKAYRQVRSLSVSDMLSWHGFGERELANWGLYGLSWVFTHWAFDTQLTTLAKYYHLLSNGDPQTAWDQTFAPMAATLDASLHQYAKVAAYKRPAITIPPRDVVPVKFAATSDTEATALEAFFKRGVKLE